MHLINVTCTLNDVRRVFGLVLMLHDIKLQRQDLTVKRTSKQRTWRDLS